jgi:outer membrane protein assembly factor BamB
VGHEREVAQPSRAAIAGLKPCATLVVIAIAAAAAAQTRSTDWTQWRGPNRDGAIASFTPPKAWPHALTRKWKVDVGLGYASPILVGSRVYLFSRRGDNETLAALDADTGKEIWRTELGAGIEGIPAIYEVAGRQFVAYCAAARATTHTHASRSVPASTEPIQGAYVALALKP